MTGFDILCMSYSIDNDYIGFYYWNILWLTKEYIDKVGVSEYNEKLIILYDWI